MPGDPLRAKFIAETFLENPKLVNSVRNMFAYTGTYKGKEVTVMVRNGYAFNGIYSYELFSFYGVENNSCWFMQLIKKMSNFMM